MKTWILLFRGINVGGRNLLPMKELVTRLQAMGFEDVRSYIQSGNVVLCSKSRPAEEIAEMIESDFGFRPELLVLDQEEFASAVSHNPWPTAEGKTVHFYFCASRPELDTAKVAKYQADSEHYTLQDRVLYLHAPEGIGRSKLVANMESCLGVSATGRNLNTINKLMAMIGLD